MNVLRATELCASTGCDEAGGDSSVDKMLVTQAGGPEFDSQHPHKKSGTLASSWNPSAVEMVGPSSLATSASPSQHLGKESGSVDMCLPYKL